MGCASTPFYVFPPFVRPACVCVYVHVAVAACGSVSACAGETMRAYGRALAEADSEEK